jgi:hypothetical protein
LSEDFVLYQPISSNRRIPIVPLRKFEDLKTCMQDGDETLQNGIMFLRGYPSPEWLCRIGAKYNVEPEFFQRHLNGIFTAEKSDAFTDPSLPSHSRHIFQLQYTTIGKHLPPVGKVPSSDLEKLRRDASETMVTYKGRLRTYKLWNVADSIVRGYNIHDKENFSIEQKMTVYFTQREKSKKSSDGWLCKQFSHVCAGTC